MVLNGFVLLYHCGVRSCAVLKLQLVSLVHSNAFHTMFLFTLRMHAIPRSHFQYDDRYWFEFRQRNKKQGGCFILSAMAPFCPATCGNYFAWGVSLREDLLVQLQPATPMGIFITLRPGQNFCRFADKFVALRPIGNIASIQPHKVNHIT